ncbi:MAG: type II toxin-antitoxin system prevent-host-death family antitoxin [Pseudomonadota bacterium]
MTKHEFGTFDAKNKLSHLLDLVEAGEEVVITRNGKPVAQLSKPSLETDEEKRARARRAMEGLKRIRESLPKDVLAGTSIRQMIEEGRR